MKKYNKEEWRKMQDEKKDKLFNRVSDIINNFQNAPENIIEYLKFNAKFHQYSNNNTILIYEQNNMARFCASYKTFKDMGYQVQKGQTGMKILVPQLLTLWFDEKHQEWKKLSESTKEEKEKVKNNEVQTKRITAFGIGNVFDIGQTDCPTSDYPTLSAGQNNPFAQYQLGMIYLKGDIADKNIDKAISFFEASADQDNQFAQYQLGKIYYFGTEGISVDKEKAAYYLTQAASQGNEYAQALLDWKPSAALSSYSHQMSFSETMISLSSNMRSLFERLSNEHDHIINQMVYQHMERETKIKEQQQNL